MNKYYEHVVATKEFLWEFFNNYNSYSNPVNIWDYADSVIDRHYAMKTIAERMAFIATVHLCTFIVHDNGSGELADIRLPATRDVLDYIRDGGFKRLYRSKRRIWLHLEDSWFPDEPVSISAFIK